MKKVTSDTSPVHPIIPSGSTPTAPQSEPTDIVSRKVAELDDALATVSALTDCTLQEAVIRTRVAYKDALANWQYWTDRANNQVALDFAVSRLDLIGAVQRRLDLLTTLDAPLLAAEAAQQLRPDEQDTLALEPPESQSLPLATNGKHTPEWSKANAALRATMSEYGLLGNAERPEQKQVRMACVSTWINRTIDSFCKMTPDEMYMVRDAIRRGDILPGWTISENAAYLKPEQMAA